MRLAPRSLFGRSLVVLAAGLMAAQAGSLVLNLLDRGSSVYRLAAFQIASRVAQTARVLNRLPPTQREIVTREIDGRHLRVSLSDQPIEVKGTFAEHDRYEEAFVAAVRRQIGRDWPVSAEISAHPRDRRAPGEGTVATPFEVWVARNFFYLLPSAFSLVCQVQLEDGTHAVFYASIPQEPLNRLEQLVPRLLLLVAICFLFATLLMLAINRPLQRLVHAADAIGVEPGKTPVPESGPSEVRRVIAAFNRMQERVHGFMHERTSLLGALSHDMMTPLTRLRLRTEMLADADTRVGMQRDIAEMEAMVGATLEFFRDVGREPERAPVDMDALLGSIVEDRLAVGQPVHLEPGEAGVYRGHALSLRRCVENLVENALRYGNTARMSIADDAEALRIAVSDDGPGIAETELEAVFEPFYRLEASRNPESGGTGLGLSIARSIARWHGGDIVLRNAPGGGLVATLALPHAAG